MSDAALLATLPATPLAGVVALLVLRHRERALAPIAVGAALLDIAFAAGAAALEPAAAWAWGPGLELRFAAVGLARVVAVLVPVVAAPVLLYAAAHEREGVARLLAWLLAFLATMELLVVAADLLSLLIGFELVALCSWALIGHQWRDPDNARAAGRALLTVRLGDLGLVFAAGAAFGATGSLAFETLGAAPRPALDAIAAGVLLATAAKSAQLPFSPWLFEAMVGPTPVSALLHSATMVAAGAYALARLAPVLEPVGWFAPTVIGVGLATALSGGVVAALHDDVKKALAASTSAQYGLMFVAIGAGSTAAAGAHLVTHAVFKSLLFLGAGIAIHAAGTGRLGEMRLGGALPGAAVAFGIGAAALAAIPPLGGGWSKEKIVEAAFHHAGWLGVGIVVAGFLSALYAGRLHLLAFGPARGAGGTRRHRLPSPAEMAGAASLAALALLLGFLWLPGAGRVVETATGGALSEGPTWEAIVSLGSVTAGLGLAALLWRRATLVHLGLPRVAGRAAASWLGLPVLARAIVVRPTRIVAADLAAFDDRVVDAGVRLAGRLGAALGRLLAARAELGFDGLVRGFGRATLLTALGSRFADDRGVDRTIEGIADGIGGAGRRTPAVQTGLVHHYLAILLAGLFAIVALFVWGR